jgi:tetratricopeptide (TPR) repeat protein
MTKGILASHLRSLIWFLPLILLASGCQGNPNARAFDSAVFNGMVYDYRSVPCAGVTVTLDEQWVIRTDVNGRFIFADVEAGEHRLSLQKPGYETVDIVFVFESMSQVFYIKMVSQRTLLEWTEQAISSKEWRKAGQLIERALAIDDTEPAVHYLRAILAIHRDEPKAALEILEELLGKGYVELSILLSIADIYQYQLGEPRSARKYLARYLEIKEDPQVRERYEGLE